ncbi:MAG: PIN domain-containing protein [Chloroflexi bacterium]|nr:PIN domain-containing protein [Chloroflexota bacterium]
MSFWAASAVVPLGLHQPATGRLRQLLREHRRPVVWWGTPVEVRSALARLAGEGAIDQTGLEQAVERLTILRRSWAEVLPAEKVRALAETLRDRHGLRAADAPQLAAALVWCNQRPRKRPFVCFDQRLAQAASKVGFAVLGAQLETG